MLWVRNILGFALLVLVTSAVFCFVFPISQQLTSLPRRTLNIISFPVCGGCWFFCLFVCFVLFCFTFLCRIEFFQQIFPANTKSQKNQIKSNGKEGQNTSVTSSDKRVVSVTDFITVLSLVFPNYLYEEKKCILHVLLLLLHQ